MAEELGTVVSTFEGPSTAAFAFVVNSARVRKGQYVQTETEDGLLFALVSDITRANRYFERAESVAEYEKHAPISASFPTTDWEYTIAACRTLGLFKDGNIVRSTFPAAPGNKVMPADEGILTKFFNFNASGVNLGKLEHHNVEVRPRLDNLLQKHIAVLGQSGSGKSYAICVLIEELLDLQQTPEQGRIGIVVADIHGEYSGFKRGAYGSRTTIYKGGEIRIGVTGLKSLAEFLPDLTPPQVREMDSVFATLKREKKAAGTGFGLDDVLSRVNESEIADKVKSVLIAELNRLKRLRLFSSGSKPRIGELVQPGKLAVLDLSDVDDSRKKQLIVSYFAKRLFKKRKKEEIAPFVFLIEEAHNFAPEKVRRSEAPAKGALETIAREGRKFGASVCLISQRPVHLSTTVLSQCNTNLILRVTNPYDVDHIGKSCEGIDKAMLFAITTLRTGEAMLVGEAVTQPIFLKIRRRKSEGAGKGNSLALMAKRFEDAKKQKSQDVEAFL